MRCELYKSIRLFVFFIFFIFFAYLDPVVVVEGFPAKDNLFEPSLLFKTVFILPKTRLKPFFLSSAGATGAPCAEELIVARTFIIPRYVSC